MRICRCMSGRWLDLWGWRRSVCSWGAGAAACHGPGGCLGAVGAAGRGDILALGLAVARGLPGRGCAAGRGDILARGLAMARGLPGRGLCRRSRLGHRDHLRCGNAWISLLVYREIGMIDRWFGLTIAFPEV